MSVKYFDKEQNKWIAFPGTIGAKGKDSYEVAVDHGYKGTYEEYEAMIVDMPELFAKAEKFIENIDEYPMQDSDNLVKSGGVFTHVDSLAAAVNKDINDKYSELKTDIDNAKEEFGNNISELQNNVNGVINEQISGINSSIKYLEDSLTELQDNLSGEVSDKVSKEEFQASAKEIAESIAAGDSNLIDRLTGKIDDPIEIVGTCIKDGVITSEHMAANYMYTKELTAEQVAAIKINADQITAGTIDAARLNLSDYLTIGDAENTYFTTDKANTLTLTGDRITGGDIKGLTIKSNDNDNPAWMLDKDGSGLLANGNILWDTNGDVTFGDNVTLSWGNVTGKDSIENDVNQAKQDAADAKEALNGKADKSEIPDVSGFITSDVIDEINNRIDNINVEIDANDVVAALQNSDSEVLSDIVNGKVKINGTSITDGSIAAEKIAANSITANQIAAGAITANEIASDYVYAGAIDATQITSSKITAEQIDATNLKVTSANIDGKIAAAKLELTDYATKSEVNNLKITSDKIEGGALSGLTISSGNGAWGLSKDGSGYFSNNAISWNKSGEAVFNGNISIGSGIEFYSGNMTFNLSQGSIKIETINNNKVAGIELKNGQIYIRNDSGQYYSTGGYYKPIDTYICDVVQAEYHANNHTLDTRYDVSYTIEGVNDSYPREYISIAPIIKKVTTPIYRELKEGVIIETPGTPETKTMMYTSKATPDDGYYTMSVSNTWDGRVTIANTGMINIQATPQGSTVAEIISVNITFKFDDLSTKAKIIHLQ